MFECKQVPFGYPQKLLYVVAVVYLDNLQPMAQKKHLNMYATISETGL